MVNMDINRLVPFPPTQNLESNTVLRLLVEAHRNLAELKGVARTIPNENILISTLTLQEAQSSSAIENIITTQDELFRYRLHPSLSNGTSKEVVHYAEALEVGFEEVKRTGLITLNTIIKIQGVIEGNNAGFRDGPVVIANTHTGERVFTPPSSEEAIELMYHLESYIYENTPLDPLIKMALIHHQFESIHPFFDANGRTGRIINILYIIKEGLLDTPILYLSRYINQNRGEYYRNLQAVRESEDWEPWLQFMLRGVAESSKNTIELVNRIFASFQECKRQIRANHKFYSQDLINNLFKHPYTKVEFLKQDLDVSRATARRYLNELARSDILHKYKLGRETYFVNHILFNILVATSQSDS